jgi:hypothetical protein
MFTNAMFVNYSKTFGLSYINDDHFFSKVTGQREFSPLQEVEIKGKNKVVRQKILRLSGPMCADVIEAGRGVDDGLGLLLSMKVNSYLCVLYYTVHSEST